METKESLKSALNAFVIFDNISVCMYSIKALSIVVFKGNSSSRVYIDFFDLYDRFTALNRVILTESSDLVGIHETKPVKNRPTPGNIVRSVFPEYSLPWMIQYMFEMVLLVLKCRSK